MTKIDGTTFVRSDDFSVSIEENGRVLLLKEALYNPQTDRWHDIRLIRHGWKLFGFNFGAGKFTGITKEMAKQIQTTYGIVLKTLGAAGPDDAAFWTNEQKTSYFVQKNASESLAKGKPFRGFFSRLIFRDTPKVKTSCPFGQKKGDLFLSAEDAGRFGESQMTLHDAVQKGIVDPLKGNRSLALVEAKRNPEVVQEKPLEEKKKESPSPAKKRENEQKTASKTKERPLTKLPSISTYREGKTPIEPGFDLASFQERRRRIVAHLDRFSPVPFSAFINQNREQKISKVLYQRMLAALRVIAKDPESKDSDARYMKDLLRHWFRSAYHYLNKNSKPGEGFAQILAQVSLEIKDQKKAEAKAKEMYW
ncbi:MAG: hypothetical protein FJZ64_04030, partial [Chlamydiae bacterium]|nr:hypothetical protein [Chlamydiota bacterium]